MLNFKSAKWDYAELHVRYLDKRFKKDVLIAIVANCCFFIGLLLSGSTNGNVLLIPVITLSLFILVYWFKAQNKEVIAKVIYFAMPIPILTYVSFYFPQIKLESLVYIPVGIAALVFIKEQKWSRIIFMCSILFCVFFQFLEVFYLNILDANFDTLNDVVLFLIISYLFSTAYLLYKTFNYYLESLTQNHQRTITSEARYRNLFDNAFDAIFIYNKKIKTNLLTILLLRKCS